MNKDLGASANAEPGSRASTEPSSTVSALTGFDPARVERVARAIAANKRRLSVDDSEIDRVWNGYCGQARAAIAAGEHIIELTEVSLNIEDRFVEVADENERLNEEIAALIHDLERQMTIANIECNQAECFRDLLEEAFHFLGGCDGASDIRDRILAAIAIEARQRTHPEEGLDPKGESAGPQDIAQGPSQ